MNSLKEGWFSELGPMFPGQSFSLEIDKVLLEKKSKFQDIAVLESKTWGRVLVLDGAIQCTDRDEFSYQEMIAHIPLCAHPNPRKVLVIGGGDGGVIREVLKHDTVESATLCEIDGDVIEVAKEFFPRMSSCLSDARVRIRVEDGVKMLETSDEKYDVIIVDSSDPIGPAEGLFKLPFYQLLKKSLNPGGIVSSQAESIWLHMHIITALAADCKQLFPSVEYAYVCTPSYPSGVIGFMINSLAGSCKKPARQITAELRYYSAGIHEAAFVLPTFAATALGL